MNDVLLKGGTVIDGEKRTEFRADVLVRDGVIAEIGENIAADGAETVNCDGLYLTAGFIDAHVHVESGMVLPEAFGEAVLPHGTTAAVTDPHEIVNVAGAEGLRRYLDEAELSPADIFVCIPSSVPATPLDTNGAGKFTAQDMKPFLSDERVVGLGEVMCYFDVAAGNPEIMDKIALFADKTVDGHTAGMPDELLDAYVAAGVSNDHECSDRSAMFKRYEKGMNIYVREGSAARNADELFAGIKERSLDVSSFAFCTDDKHLATIEREGHISFIFAKALAAGFTRGEAAAMASYNPCRFYKLKNRGNMRCGYIADIVAANSDFTKIVYVLKDGVVVAKDAKLCVERAKRTDKQASFENSVKMRELKADDFALPERLENVALELVDGQLLTLVKEVKPEERSGLNLLATAERHGKNGNLSVCLLANYGIKDGAVATSVSHDSHNVVCAGDNAADMALACNRLRETGGGYVIASRGRIAGELPMPAYGLMSVKCAAETSAEIARLEEIAHSMGVNPAVDAFTTLSFVALPVIPFLRLLDTGLYDTEKGEFL